MGGDYYKYDPNLGCSRYEKEEREKAFDTFMCPCFKTEIRIEAGWRCGSIRNKEEEEKYRKRMNCRCRKERWVNWNENTYVLADFVKDTGFEGQNLLECKLCGARERMCYFNQTIPPCGKDL